MKQLVTGSIIGLIVLSILSQAGTPHAVAQTTTVKWDAPINLSNSPTSSSNPAIVTDPYGYVHVLWSEDIGGATMAPSDNVSVGNSIIYTRWDGESWTTPVDVLFVPDDNVADFPAAAVDARGRLHVVWTGLTNIYYSSAPAQSANSAHAWTEPIVITSNSARSRLESSVGIDRSGNVHIVYATRGEDPGVFHVVSHDGGATWSAPTKLSQPLDRLETSFSNVRIVIDPADRLHITWQTNEVQGYGQAAYYARSTDEGQTWSTPLQLVYRGPTDFEVGWAYLTAVSESELRLVYIGNGEHPIGRVHRISLDGGQTWSAPREILTDMEGINGYIVPVVDGAQGLHLLINMRTRDTQAVGIYYSQWQGADWSQAVPLVDHGPSAGSAHRMDAAVYRGDEIFVVWNQILGGEIWLIHGTVQSIAQQPIESVPIIKVPTPAPTSTTSVASTSITRALPAFDRTPPSAANSPLSNSFLPGVGLASVVIALVVIRMRLRAHR